MSSKEYTPFATNGMDIEKGHNRTRRESREYPMEMPNAPRLHSLSGGRKPALSGENADGRQRCCSNCGHAFADETLDIYPPPRPMDRIQQQHFTFIGYVLLIAIVIFLTFVAVKYLA